jgi:hypothetical protein
MKFGASLSPMRTEKHVTRQHRCDFDAGTNNIDLSNVELAAGGAFTGLTGLGGAWTDYTPTVTVGSGSITTLGAVSGRHKKFGRLVMVELTVTVTTNGTAGTSIAASLPFASANLGQQAFLPGALGSGAALNGWVQANSSVCYLRNYDGTYTFADGTNYRVSGMYEAAA